MFLKAVPPIDGRAHPTGPECELAVHTRWALLGGGNMRRTFRAISTMVAVPVFVALGAGPALAHDCFNTQKAAGSGGTVGVYDEKTDTFTPSATKGNATFVEIRFADGSSGFLFLHNGPDGVVPGAKDCDGKGLDNFTHCVQP